MRHLIIFPVFISTISFGQTKDMIGTFTNGLAFPKLIINFNADSTFEYNSTEHPTFYNWEGFSEKGRWTISGDTISLNPDLPKKLFVESDFKEEVNPADTNLTLTFNHIKRYFDGKGNIIRMDTIQIERLDYSFNEWRKKKLTRIATTRTTRCTFAGYIPKEIITTSRTISIHRPAENIQSIFVGCYELQKIKEFTINNPNSNHFTLNIYSNYYQDGQIRQLKFLIKNENVLYTRQKTNGAFETGNIWNEAGGKLKRNKVGS